MLAGLREDADKGPQNYTGRTFVGIDDANQDNIYETVLIFNSKTARQPDAAQILRDSEISVKLCFPSLII